MWRVVAREGSYWRCSPQRHGRPHPLAGTPDLEAGRAVAAAERAHAPAKELTGVLNRTPGLARWFSVALCLMPWSSNVGPEIGSPLVFGECRQRRARNQRWAEEPVSGGTSRGRFRLRLVGTTLCVASNLRHRDNVNLAEGRAYSSQ